MGYLQPPGQQRGGYATQFGPGVGNPAVGGIQRPTGRTAPGGGGGIATVYSTSPERAGPVKPWDDFKKNRGQKTYSGSSGGGYSRNRKQNNREHIGFNEPDMPDLRTLGDVERYTGEKWSPDRRYDETNIDPSEMIESRFALIDERLGGEMSEAARRFGSAGALMSGGGLGGGYAGTLGESERGAMRDKRQIGADLTYNAAQAEAERRARAFEAEQQRSLSAHEGYEGRRFSDVDMANKYGITQHDRGVDDDRYRYEQELEIARREQQNAIAEMMAQYGM